MHETMTEKKWMKTINEKGVHSVYVICADEQSVKIGVSSDPARRAIAIQTGQDREIRVFWAIDLWKPQAREVEHAIHKRLRGAVSHIRGEWYLLGPAQAVAEIKGEIARRGFQSEPNVRYGWDARA